MPRYFFHIHDGEHVIDELGAELAGLPEARAHAIETAGHMLREISPKPASATRWRMQVTDERTATVLRLHFSTDGLTGDHLDPGLPSRPIVEGAPLSFDETRLLRAFRAVGDGEVRETLLSLMEHIVADTAFEKLCLV